MPTLDVPLMFPKPVIPGAPAGTQIRCAAPSDAVPAARVDTRVCGVVSLCLSSGRALRGERYGL